MMTPPAMRFAEPARSYAWKIDNLLNSLALRARFERPRLGTYTSLGSQDTFNEGVTRGSVRCAQKRNCSRVRVPCRDRSTSPAVYVRVISWRVRFQNGLLVIPPAFQLVWSTDQTNPAYLRTL